MAARAFATDPLFRFVYPDPDRLVEGFAREHAAYIRHIYHPYGVSEAVDVGGSVAGVALWLTPHTRVPAWREWLLLPPLARAVGVKRLSTVLRAYRAFDEALPPQPYWYLGLLAVAPEAQRRGVGRMLVEAGLKRADADGVPTFLETGTQENIQFYRRLGFEVTGDILIPEGPTHWAMTRPAGAPPDADD